MKKTVFRCEQLQEECNMLKSKIIVVETKECMEDLAEDTDFKDMEERVIASVLQNDPLTPIKNSSDSSHFQIMKGYVVELKQKLSKAVLEKREYEKKYRLSKDKLLERADKTADLEEQNQLLKGKLEGYERLT